jgi:D-alanyl-D-alanine carboxypeptidase
VAHSSWGSGWPNCQPNKISSGFVVSGTKFPGGMRHELVDLASMLVQECKNRGYRFGTSGDPSYGCWGYSCRCISGTNSASNHSWGLALDINAPSNPYTSPLVTDMPGWMPDLFNAYGFRWGGDYSGSKDAMHYEFMGSVSDAANETVKARSKGLGGGSSTIPEPPTPEPTPEPKPDQEDDMPRRVLTVYDSAMKATGLVFDGPTGVVPLRDDNEVACVRAVIDENDAVNAVEIDVYNAVLARGQTRLSAG